MKELLFSANKKLRERKYKQALKLYKRVLVLDKKNTDALCGIADCLYNLRMNEEAKDTCIEILALNQELARPHVILSYIHDDLQVSRKEAEIALRLEPNSSEALCCYGILLVLENKPKDAIEYLTKATQIDPSNYLAHYNLGVCYYQIGKKNNYFRQRKIMLGLKPSIRNLARLLVALLENYRLLNIALILFPLLYYFTDNILFFLPHFFLILLDINAALDSFQNNQPQFVKQNLIMAILLIITDLLFIFAFANG